VAQLESSRVNWIKGTYSPEHLEGAFLVVAATDDQSLNAAIVESAAERGILVCDASSAERSQVIFGALHRSESNVTIAVFTDGRDPAEARRTRDRIAGLLDLERRVQDQSGPS
jgi:uroporphyrin-III C-methyltransferase/precorrin-2 dehydrogenase/sirohydrochlorin ferrochelatase